MARIIPEPTSTSGSITGTVTVSSGTVEVSSGTIAVSSGTVTVGSITEPTDAAGNVQTTLNTLIAGEDITNDRLKVEHQYSGTYIATATTTTVKSGAGFIHTLTIGETAAGAITLYDNTAGSGTIIFVAKASIVEQTFVLDVSFTVGLTIVTAAASKLMVSYR